jgi:MEMO1 family protein
MRRRPAVSGQFYDDSPAKLTSQVKGYVAENLPKKRAIGILSPHAGLIYSGPVAGSVYSRLEMPGTFVLLGPNHTGLGSPVSLMPQGEWEVPTCIFQIDEALSEKILKEVPIARSDAKAHLFEHSLEVQLPFIAYFSKGSRIVPITILSASLEECRAIGEGIGKVVGETCYSVVIVASSDMSHYVSDETARKKDGMAIDHILSLDPEGLYMTVRKEQISMCGYLPATVMLYAAKSLGAREAVLCRYATSGEISGDYDHVVGYAGIIVS